ncbi:MAG: Gfo/Idh/MocA family oxidoreductase [Planctomycetota bacterium]|nr:Gfo/Idh/MocA family oxidoreductase [Planctomycetota bacterium]
MSDQKLDLKKMNQITVAVIGCGAQGRVHLSCVQACEAARLIAVCDTNPERAEESRKEFGAERAYTDFSQVIENENVDLITLAVPVKFHADQAVDAFEAGANVLCEKPLAMNAAEAEAIFNAAKKAGKKLGMGLQSRHRKEGEYLKKFIVEGNLGRIFHTRIYCGHSMNIPGHGDLHKQELSGGGVLFATTVHPLDMAMWLIGNPDPARVTAHNFGRVHHMKEPAITWHGNLEECDVEDFCAGFVHFADGSTLDFYSDWLSHGMTAPQIEIHGEYGKASFSPFRITLDDGKGFKEVTPDVEQSGGFQEVVSDFVRSIQEDEVPRFRFSEMRNVQRIMDAAYESVNEGREAVLTSDA